MWVYAKSRGELRIFVGMPPKQLRALSALAPNALLPKRNAQVLLGHCPVLRQLLARENFQGAAAGGDGLGQQFASLGALAPNGLLRKRKVGGASGRGRVQMPVVAGPL